MVTQSSKLRTDYSNFQQSINHKYFDFKTKHSNAIKTQNKASVLDKCLETYLKRYEKDSTVLSKLELNIIKELNCRIEYTAKVEEVLKTNTGLSALAQTGKIFGNVHLIRQKLDDLSKSCPKSTEIEKLFVENLKSLLNKP